MGSHRLNYDKSCARRRHPVIISQSNDSINHPILESRGENDKEPPESSGRLRRFGRFLIYRQAAWLEWGIGIAAGNVMAGVGLPRVAASVVVFGAVMASESAQTAHERKQLGSVDDKKRVKSGHFVEAAKEVLAFSQSLWQGAPAVMSYNRSVGLENNTVRNNVHSGAYAAAVSYWVSPLPGAEWGRSQATKGAITTAHYFAENPIGASAGAAATATIVFAAYEGIHALLRERK